VKNVKDYKYYIVYFACSVWVCDTYTYEQKYTVYTVCMHNWWILHSYGTK